MHNEDVVAGTSPEKVAIGDACLLICLQLLRLGYLDENGLLSHQQGYILILFWLIILLFEK